MKKPAKITKGQEKLTPEQEEYAKYFAKRWIERQLSTNPVNEQSAERLIKKAYEVAGVTFPSEIIWVDSPIELIASVRASVWDSVRASVSDSVWDSVRASVRASVSDSVWAYYDADDMSFYDFFNTNFQPNKLRYLARFNQMVSGYYLGNDKVVIVRRPKILSRDANGRLHSETGQAIEYHNGWGVYSLHGVRFTDKRLWKKIVDRKLNFKQCMGLENIEHRMIALKFLEPEKLLKNANAELLDSSKRGNELYLIKDIFSTDAYFLKYSCPSTGRVYLSGIDPEVGIKKDADLSMSWKHNLTKEQYQNIYAES